MTAFFDKKFARKVFIKKNNKTILLSRENILEGTTTEIEK